MSAGVTQHHGCISGSESTVVQRTVFCRKYNWTPLDIIYIMVKNYIFKALL